MALASSEGWLFLLRWIHFFAGITWIGLLYYFNFVQTPVLRRDRGPGAKRRDPEARASRALVVPLGRDVHLPLRAGSIIVHRSDQGGFFAGSYGWAILLGGLLGTLMWAERLVRDLAQPEGRHPERDRHGRGTPREPGRRRRRRAGRTRVPDEHAALDPDALLHGRGEPPHTAGTAQRDSAFWVVALAILLVVEINALKGTPGQGAAKPLATVKGTIWAGVHPRRRVLRVVRGDALADRSPILHRSPSGPGRSRARRASRPGSAPAAPITGRRDQPRRPYRR